MLQNFDKKILRFRKATMRLDKETKLNENKAIRGRM